MPQFLIDWNNWWIGMFTNYPALFWLLLVAGLWLVVVRSRAA